MVGNMKKARVSIRGTRPFLYHVFGPDALSSGGRSEKEGSAGNNPSEWKKTFHATKEGQLYVPGTYIFGAIVNGSRYTKQGRGSIQPAVRATLQVLDDRILFNRYYPGYPNGKDFDVTRVDPPLQDPDLPVYLDIRGVVNPSTKGRNIRYRVTMAPGWEGEFTLLWDGTLVSVAQMEASIIDAGKLFGLGSARAIGMGRFQVLSFETFE